MASGPRLIRTDTSGFEHFIRAMVEVGTLALPSLMLAQELLTDKNLSQAISSGLSRFFVSPRDLVDAPGLRHRYRKASLRGLAREENT